MSIIVKGLRCDVSCKCRKEKPCCLSEKATTKTYVSCFFMDFDCIYFLAKPSAPESPLEASDITGESLTLKWEPSKKDGGSPITGYVIEMRETWKSKCRPCGKTQPDDLTFKVAGLKDGDEYFFRVCAENVAGQSEFLEIKKPVKVETPKSELLIIKSIISDMLIVLYG